MMVRPLDVRVPDPVLTDLAVRLDATRLPPDDADTWEAGTNPAYLRELVDYWRTGFDWRAHEAELRRLSHFKAIVGGATIHFIHERGRGDAPLPLVLTHGFPDSFLRFRALIPLLVDPAAHGGDPADAFDVVIPSLPGFAYSPAADEQGDVFHVAERWHELMTGLGYRRYGAHGGDWGSTITERLAWRHPRAVVGIHLTDVPFWHAFARPRRRSDAEEAYLDAIADFQQREGAYAVLQGTRPQTLADGLHDSPAGLAAWIVDFYARWCDGDLETAFSKDDLLANVMLYWVTRSIGTSFTPYRDVTTAGAAHWLADAVRQHLGAKKVPAAFALFPRDLTHPPREWAERFFAVARWTEMPRGGHFAALEEPELLAEDLRAFFRPLRARLRR